MNMAKIRIALVVVMAAAFLAAGCDIREYCEAWRNCVGGNDEDEKACREQLRTQEDVADIYDCEDDFDTYLQCLINDSECDNDYYYSDCGDQYEDLDHCIDAASAID